MKLKQKSVIALLIILCVIVSGFAIRHIFFPTAVPHYLTAPVLRADIEETVLASGTLQPSVQVSVGAQVSGQLESLKVALGERVSKGQLLAEIDPVQQQNALRKAQAILHSIEAQYSAKQALLRQAELALKRQQRMVAGDASSHAELESAQAQFDSAKAELAAIDAQILQSKIEVDIARANLSYTRIVAPIDGEVISVVTKEGQTIVSAQSATTILVLANLDTMTVKAHISEADVVHVKPGQRVYFTILGALDQRFDGNLRGVEPVNTTFSDVPSTTTTATVSAVYYNGLFEVPNPEHILRPSMTAQVSIVRSEAKQVLTIPVAALGKKNSDGRYVVRVLRNDVVQSRHVQIGINNHVIAQVIDGLAEHEEVIVGDPSQLMTSTADSDDVLGN